MQTSDTASGESFDEVLDRLEATLRIDLIAADELASCQRDELCSSVLERGEWARFDQFPVRDDERVIGVFGTSRGPEGWCRSDRSDAAAG